MTGDVPRLRRGRAQNTVAFTLRATFAEMPDAAELASVSNRVSTEFGGDSPTAEQWIKTPHGWSGVLVDTEEFGDGVTWLNLFASAYGDSVDGVVWGQTRASGGQLGSNDVIAGPVTAVAYTTGDLTTVPSNDRGPLWFVDPDVTESVVAAAQDWVITPGCRRYITRSGGYWGLEIEGLDWQRAVVEAINRYVNVLIVSRRSKPTRMRKVEMWPHGLVSFAEHDPTVSWAEKLSAARATLHFAVPGTDLAFISNGDPSGDPWRPDTRRDSWPHVTEPQVRYNRPLLASMVPDVHGLQVLTKAHLERAHDLSAWDVTEVAPDRFLVEAADLEAWYAGPLPDQMTREKARQDFGSMIMTPDRIEADFPWPEIAGYNEPRPTRQ